MTKGEKDAAYITELAAVLVEVARTSNQSALFREAARTIETQAAEITRLRVLVAETGSLAGRRAEVIEIQASVMEKQAAEILSLRAAIARAEKEA